MKKYQRIYGITYKSTRPYATQQKLQTNKKWNSVVGLEIHAQINSAAKLFSGASAEFGKPINSCVSLFDCATPGTLPVLNRKCVEAGVLTALALSCDLNRVSFFDRKHYFYADLPAGYQITQQRKPLAVDGELTFHVFETGAAGNVYTKSSRIKQIQLEQDSGKSLHDHALKKSLVDLNRAGVPLMELVFEPDLSDGEEAAALVKELVNILQRLETCTCKMEEGALRVDANISVNRPGEGLGVRTEVKNIGSVRAVATAIKYEIRRQIEALEAGEKIVNETLSWDVEEQKTVSMRNKEEKQDYRFMPEPNLPPLHLFLDGETSVEPEKREKTGNTENLVDVNYLRSILPEMPEDSRVKLRNEFKLSAQQSIVIVNEAGLWQLFVDAMRENSARNGKILANILTMELLTILNKNKLELENCAITGSHVGDLVDLLERRIVNLTIAKKILLEIISRPERTPTRIIEENGWAMIVDEAELRKICEETLGENPKIVAQYKSGKKNVAKALLGEISRRTAQKADMKRVTEILDELLK